MSDPASFVARIAAQAERRETPCGEGITAWRRWGAGAPLVLLHGGSGSWTHWIRNIEALSRGREVWAPDLPGFGDSALAPDPFDLGSISEAVATGLNVVFKDRKVDLVGFSFGSRIAGILADRYPDRVRRVVLVGSNVANSTTLDMRSWRKLSDPAEIRAAHHHNLAQLMFGKAEHIDELAIYLQTENNVHARFNRRKRGSFELMPEIVARLKVPVGGVWGALDILAQDPYAPDAMRNARSDARIKVIPDAGHWVMYEAADAFNTTLEEVLQ